LLLGMPRSGTTWLGKIFDSAPNTLYRHEPDSYGRLRSLPLAPAVEQTEALSDTIKGFFETVTQIRDTKVTASTPIFPKDYLNGVQAMWNRAAILGTKALSRVFGELPVPLSVPGNGPRGHRVVVKSIESITRAGVYARALPTAHVVILLRHPFGFVASMLRGKAGHHFTDSGSIGEDLALLDLLREAEGVDHLVSSERLQSANPAERLAWQWVLANDKALADTEGLANVTVVRYEDLCAAAPETTQALFEWCGLPYTNQTRRFLDESTSGHQERYYSVYKSPLRAANAWRQELDDDTRAALQDIVMRSRSARLFGGDL